MKFSFVALILFAAGCASTAYREDRAPASVAAQGILPAINSKLNLASDRRLSISAKSFHSRSRSYMFEGNDCYYSFEQNPAENWGKAGDPRFNSANDWNFTSSDDWYVKEARNNFEELDTEPSNCYPSSSCFKPQQGKIVLGTGRNPNMELSIHPNTTDVEVLKCLKDLGFD